MRGVLGKALVRAVVLTALIVAGYMAAKPFLSYPTDPDAIYKGSGQVKALYDHRDSCWTGPSPYGDKVPTHSVVRTDASTPFRYVGPKWTTRALEHVFEDKWPDMKVVAFCL